MKNSNEEPRCSRREFCGMTVGGTLGAVAFGWKLGPVGAAARGPAAAPPVSAAARPTVAVVRDPGVWAGEGLGIDRGRLREMVDRAVCLALGKNDPLEAWKTVVKPTDVVGLKINCLGGRSIATRLELVEIVVRRLLDVGLPAGNVIVWDRNDSSLRRAGYPVRKEPDQVRYLGMPEMGETAFEAAGIATRLSRAITDDCTVLLNLPVLKSHQLAGYTGALKNTMGAIPNPRDFHRGRCVGVGDLNALKPLRTKSRLVIMDALRPLHARGPGDYPPARWKYHGILASTDPVALDRVGRSVLEKKRRQAGAKRWRINVPHIERAGKLGLGQSHLKKIRVRREGGA